MNPNKLHVGELLDLERTIACDVFNGITYPWEALPKIKEFISALGSTLDLTEFEQRSPSVWIHRTAVIYPTAYIEGPCIIDAGAEVRHCAFIRGNAIVGKNAVVGNSTELKNVILFDAVQVPHYNYVGDSILGFKAHMGAGAITSNVKSDKTLIHVKAPGIDINTGLKKFAAILGDHVEVGCNSVLNPGSVIGRYATIYPTSCARGVLEESTILKNTGTVAVKE